MHQERFGKHLQADCSALFRDSDGKSACRAYKTRSGGCRLFPWNPLQLSNTEYEDLPRIPIYKSGRYITFSVVNEGVDSNGNPERKLVFDQKDVTNDDFEIVNYLPFSERCSFRFIDVTEKMKRKRPNLICKVAKEPVVHMQKPESLK
jgi:hypothetical protein